MKWINCIIFQLNAKLITKINKLKGDDFISASTGLTIIAAIIIIANNTSGFQLNPHAIVPPYLEWLYGNNYKLGQFGYKNNDGLRSSIFIEMT